MIKQVIVIRKDLKMRRGKEIAQGSHASMAFLSQVLRKSKKLTDVQKQWLEGTFTKVVCKVNSEEELRDIEERAKAAGLECHLIVDSGRTEFKSVPTPTCVAIGPDKIEKIDEITANLELY
ncbi:MAG: aminoacyl-tRNA hydrolase [Planctomycetota bacterium]